MTAGSGLARMGWVKGGAIAGGAYGFALQKVISLPIDDAAYGAALGASGGYAF